LTTLPVLFQPKIRSFFDDSWENFLKKNSIKIVSSNLPFGLAVINFVNFDEYLLQKSKKMSLKNKKCLSKCLKKVFFPAEVLLTS